MLIVRARGLFVYKLVAKNGRELVVAGATGPDAAPQPLEARAIGTARETARDFNVSDVEPNRGVMAVESPWS